MFSPSAEKDGQSDRVACEKKLKASFSSHDQAVDVVSCWHSFFDSIYSGKGDGLYFDRFPRIGASKLTPDFTMLFSDKYGIVAEVARSIDYDMDVLESKARQLKSYDVQMSLSAGRGHDAVVPETVDILLLLHTTYSNRGTKLLFDLLERRKEFKPENNLIVMDYDFSQSDAQTMYVFKKMLYEKNGYFRDSALPDEKRLEKMLGIEQKPLKCSPDKFVVNKATYALCNDAPCPIYLATRLWDRVLMLLLSDSDKVVWRQKSSTRTVGLKTSVDSIRQKIVNDIAPGCELSNECITSALEFLQVTGRAEKNGNEWLIHYGNLPARKRKKREGVSAEASLFDMRENGEILAEMYCRGLAGEKWQVEPLEEEETEDEVQQMTILDYLGKNRDS
jgi:hypothetical protein